MLIGGMPEIITQYAATNDVHSLKPIYETLIESYSSDVEKYADTNQKIKIIRYVESEMPLYSIQSRF